MKLGWLMVILLAISAITYYFLAFNMEYSSNELFKRSYDERDYSGALGSIFGTEPAIDLRAFLGNETAPLTIMVAVDLASEDSKRAYQEQAPWLVKEYVETGKARLYHKYYLPREDFMRRSPRYLKSLAALCYKGNDTVGFHLSLFDTAMQPSCQSHPSLYQDMHETEEFMITSPSIIVGIDGADNTAIYGTPSLDFIHRRMRSKEIKVGI